MPQEIRSAERALGHRPSPSQENAPPVVETPLPDRLSALRFCLHTRTEQWHKEKKLFREVYFKATSDIYALKSELIDLLADREALVWEEMYDDDLDRMSSAWQEKIRQNDMMWRQLLAQENELKKVEELHELAKQEAKAAMRRYEVKIRDIEDAIWTKADEAKREKGAKKQKKKEKVEDPQREGPNSADWRRRARAESSSEESTQQDDYHDAAEELEKQEPRSMSEVDIEIRTLQDHLMRLKLEKENAENKCRHYGWWAKVEGEAECPYCKDIWKYLLECPHCPTQACPKCQVVFRFMQHDS